jgi:adenosine deaminase
VPSAAVSGHDQFFATFDRFNALDKSHAGEWLDEVATRAAAQNEQYLEVMQTPSFFDLAPLWNSLGWPATPAGAAVDPEGDATGTSRAELDALRTKLLAGGLRDEVALDMKEFDEALAARDRIEHCGKPDASPACSVKIRFLYQVLRANPPQQVFAQTLLAFEVASADPNVVGLNFVQPEDATLSMSEYNRQMHMLDYLHSAYPKVHISLHAGELAPGLVPPEGLKFHIREAVELGHAERIGHGVDVMFETDPRGLLNEMAARHVMVEINLTSNDAILGVVPPHHPLPEYRAAHVPVALSTDDEGVSRIDLTHEYVRAAMEYGLRYLDLKAMARSSLEHSFLPGESLWAKPDVFTQVNAACAGQAVGAALPTARCRSLLGSSEKAAEQWELERRFAAFEAGLP